MWQSGRVGGVIQESGCGSLGQWVWQSGRVGGVIQEGGCGSLGGPLIDSLPSSHLPPLSYLTPPSLVGLQCAGMKRRSSYRRMNIQRSALSGSSLGHVDTL